MLRIALLCGLLLLSGLAKAENESYNRADFQVDAAREVANDVLVAIMSTNVQQKQYVSVAQQLNATLNDALKISAAFSTIKTTSGNQNTYPVYGKNNQIDTWRGHAEIRLESRNFKDAGELIMQLQSTMQLGNVQFSVAPDTRTQIENALITEAIKTFQMRANTVRTALGATSYKVVRLSISGGNSIPPYRPNMAMRAALADSAIPAPEFSAGDSRITVQINGTIEMR